MYVCFLHMETKNASFTYNFFANTTTNKWQNVPTTLLLISLFSLIVLVNHAIKKISKKELLLRKIVKYISMPEMMGTFFHTFFQCRLWENDKWHREFYISKTLVIFVCQIVRLPLFSKTRPKSCPLQVFYVVNFQSKISILVALIFRKNCTDWPGSV